MQSHTTGPVLDMRPGAFSSVQSFSLDITNNTTGVDYLLCTVKASAAQPVSMRLTGVVVAPDNSGTSATWKLGSSANGTQFFNAVDIKAAAAGDNFATANPVIVLVANTDIYARITRVGTAATTGQVVLLVSLAEININQP